MRTLDNYYVETYAEFKICETPNREPDYTSDSGSKYWYEGNEVIRQSDHWGKVSGCIWVLKLLNYKEGDLIAASCSLQDFINVDDREVNKYNFLINTSVIYQKQYGSPLCDYQKPHLVTFTTKDFGAHHFRISYQKPDAIYFFTEEGVFIVSDDWGYQYYFSERYIVSEKELDKSYEHLGFAKWTDFKKRPLKPVETKRTERSQYIEIFEEK